MQASEARLASLYRRFDNIDAVLDGYRSAPYTMTEGGRVLKDQASRLLAEARQALRYRWKRLEPLEESSRESLRRTMCDDFAAVLIELSATLLPALEGTRSNGVPIELEPVLTRLVGQASGGSGGRVVLYASEHLNYSIERHRDPMTVLAKELSPGSGKPEPTGDPFLFLRIPRIERDTGTLHTVIMGHELGHLRDWTHGLSQLLPPISVPANWLDEVGSIKIDYLGEFQRFKYVAAAWAGEIVADIVAAVMFGPASLQALSELVGTLGLWTADSATHPGTDRRAAIIHRLLLQSEFGDIPEISYLLDHFETESTTAIDRPVQVDGSPYPEADQAAWELLKGKLAALQKACERVIDMNERFTAADWALVEAGELKLSMGQPCGERIDETGQPVAESDAVILNAAYLHRLKSSRGLGGVLGLDTLDPVQASLVGAVLDGLVLKSFEVAEFRRRTAWE